MSKRDLTQGPVPLTLLKLTVPLTLGVSSSILVSVLELGFIGQLGTEYIAAITFTFPITMMLSSIALGIGIGTSSVIARSVGSGKKTEVQRLGSHSLILVASLIALISLLGWLSIDPLFLALGASEKLLPYIHDYLVIYYPSVIPLALGMVAGNIMRANGNAYIPGMLMMGGALIQLALDPILIFGWLGMPRLELAGAATALAVSRFLVLAAMLWYALRGQLLLTQHVIPHFFNSCQQILKVGLPAIATQLIGPVSAAIITRLLATHGEVVVAGFGVATRIEAVAVMVLFALSGSVGPLLGQNWGANLHDRVRKGVTTSYQFSLAWGLIAALCIYLFGETIASWIDDSETVISIAAVYFIIVPWSYGFWGILMMASSSFNALGKPLPSTILSFTRMFIVYIPLAMMFERYFGYQGIFIATGISNLLMGLIGYVWFRRNYF